MNTKNLGFINGENLHFMNTKILDFNIFNGSKKQLLHSIFSDNKKYHIVSGNPEVLSIALNNSKLLSNFKSENTIIIPDGVGVVIASKMVRNTVKEKIAGIEVMQDILDYSNRNSKSVYLLGATQDTVEALKQKLNIIYKGINICGIRNGYFNKSQEDEVINDIIKKKPFALFVAMGCPRQEEFIINTMDRIECKIMMGVGGSFDVISGRTKRAPKWMINIGLEWLYRIVKEPWRIKRLSVIPFFILKVLKDRKIKI
ncbi:N-acetylglucosaminyldiphosphoundecaprenol N-acetyl-beta-D-mannosaminyltransferase [Clostridium amylolyticum]|uniref:N-acetylglucosaminyldiphosphoundecaprenol N-acetyl-beta-D-mannosaminyltransferase n=2 Tax=Clostridium amylolyticum TaxID=1121298 RepID=A0A1M6KM61_9CLOT|nr:N-acetylglucosaminyldiphosphoundecaprenol N-acetyl-beta-D-mannosaminyltransferase [Clostridium amylolyticum]